VQGIAKSMVADVCACCAKDGLQHLYVHVVADNEAGLALYESCGFDVESEESALLARQRQHGRRLLLHQSLQ
jgi:ribosomal protein S18 acetylase RimI-like enzyme